MTRNKLITILAVTTMAAMMQTAQATITLADLAANGGAISIGDKTFSGFSYAESGLTSFDASQIYVKVYQDSSGVDYLTWSGNISLATLGTTTADLKLNYIVTASAGAINMIDQAYTGSAYGGGLLAVDETVAIGSFGGTPVGNSHLGALDINDPPAEANDLLNIVPPQILLYVTKDIRLAAIAPPGSFVSISQVTQSFHQVPEPTTIIAGALLLLPFGASTLRILRRKQTA
jgi:hypothetical protein